MTADDEDLPDVGPPLSRRQYVISEIEHLVQFKHWPEEVARQLGYSDADSLQAVLQKWGRPDLALHFERWRYDALVPTRIVKQVESRRRRQQEAA